MPAAVKSKTLAIVSSLLAGILWGSWAFYINTGASNVWTSTIVQFVSSMVMTGIMSVVILKTQPMFKAVLMRVAGPALIASAIAVMILVTSHVLADTEKVVPTIIAPALVGLAYCLFFAHRTQSDQAGLMQSD